MSVVHQPSVSAVTLLNPETPAMWPEPLRDYLNRHADLFLDWEVGPRSTSARDYDHAVYGLIDTLQPYSLRGWHCTRLTDWEIDIVLTEGLALPDLALLSRRIDNLVGAGLLDPQIASRLKARNQAAYDSRAGMLWFCFYPPGRAGESGIERFFRHWGGEALYNSHEDDPITAPVLAGLGRPCLIEADVPIASLPPHGGLYTTIYRRFLAGNGVRIREPMDHEDRMKRPLPADGVRRVVRFPEPDFLALTGCAGWRHPIQP